MTHRGRTHSVAASRSNRFGCGGVEACDPVIDKHHARFLDFLRFGVPGSGGQYLARTLSSLVPLTLAVSIGGCSSRPAAKAVEDSVTSGRISVVSANEAVPLLGRERDAFVALYPEATFRLAAGTSREAVRALFAADCDAAVLSRDLTPEERGAAVRGGLELEGYRFAKDAVVVVVHPSNPVENLALDDLRRIYDGRIGQWRVLDGPSGAIEPVFPSPDSDMADYFVEQVMGGQSVRARVVIAANDSETVAAVKERPRAIGFVSLAWAEHGTKSLRISTLQGLPYWKPDLEAIHQGEYPLTRPLSIYLRANGPRLAQGLVTFITSRDGQMIVHEAGLVPTSVPIRFVRRSPMRGAH